MKLHRRSIATRLLLLVLGGTGLVLGSSLTRTYLGARRLLEDQVRTDTVALAASTADHIEGVIVGVQKVAQGLAREVEANPPATPAAAAALLTRLVRDNPEVYGSALAPVPLTSTFPTPYAYRRHGRVVTRTLGGPAYETARQEWYARPCALRRPVWSEPYYDRGGGEALMVTYSVPVFDRRPGHKLRALVTCDVAMPWLDKLIRSLPLGKTGYAFVISPRGTYMVHANRYFVMRETVFSAARKAGRKDLADTAVAMVAGKTGFLRLTSLATGRPSFLGYSPVPAAGWSVAVVMGRDEVLAPVLKLGRVQLLESLVGFLLLAGVSLLIARSIARPIRALEAATHLLAAGNLDAPLPQLPGQDEVASLASSFSAMRDNLVRYIANLRETTAANERLRSELEIAAAIQHSLLPAHPPVCPGAADYDLFALLDPAREIGGDFYNYLHFDDHTIGLTIGDVSGKGIPAAIFMGATTTLLKALWPQDPSPAATMTRLNDELARENESCMFVTLLCATIDLRTGQGRFACGGHLPPFLVRRDGHVEPLPEVRGALVGALPGTVFEEGTFQLAPGEVLFLYTDGVTEAVNEAEEEFGPERAMAALGRECSGCDMAGIVRQVRETIRQFTGPAEQFDDIAMVAFRWRGG